jgi:hypothetical protein
MHKVIPKNLVGIQLVKKLPYLRDPKVHYSIQNSLSLVPVVRQINPFETPIALFEDQLYYSPIYA